MKRKIFLLLSSLLLVPLPAIATPLTVFNGRLSTGFDMGINTSGGKVNWATVKGDEICLNYPSGQKWGALFITVGKPRDSGRAGKDMSSFKKLTFEIKGTVGKESVSVAIKDATDPDNAKETRIPISLTTAYKKFEFPLSRFKTADLKTIYIPLELVFSEKPANICVRQIQYLD
jgi:hypothetical protein